MAGDEKIKYYDFAESDSNFKPDPNYFDIEHAPDEDISVSRLLKCKNVKSFLILLKTTVPDKNHNIQDSVDSIILSDNPIDISSSLKAYIDRYMITDPLVVNRILINMMKFVTSAIIKCRFKENDSSPEKQAFIEICQNYINNYEELIFNFLSDSASMEFIRDWFIYQLHLISEITDETEKLESLHQLNECITTEFILEKFKENITETEMDEQLKPLMNVFSKLKEIRHINKNTSNELLEKLSNSFVAPDNYSKYDN